MSEAKPNRITLCPCAQMFDWIAFRGQMPAPPPEKAKDVIRMVQAWLRIYWRKWVEEKEVMPALQAGKLDLLWLPENDLLAEPKRAPLIALHGLSRLDHQVIRRVLPDHWRITRDLVFLFDETQGYALWPAGKWLTLSEEDKRRFVEAYAENHPEMGADTLHNFLPLMIRRQIPRDPFRQLMPERTGGRPRKPRQKTG